MIRAEAALKSSTGLSNHPCTWTERLHCAVLLRRHAVCRALNTRQSFDGLLFGETNAQLSG